MLTLSEPMADTIRRFLAAQAALPLSYAPAGLTRGPAPAGYTADRRRQRLGDDDAAFGRACAALRSWAMFRQDWIRLAPDDPPAVGTAVAVCARVGPLWWLNACRVVYLIDEPRRVGFAYGTLADHAERGEERFAVEQLADGSVWYDLLAYSRPRHWLARAGYPLTRAFQKRFGRGSAAAMAAASR